MPKERQICAQKPGRDTSLPGISTKVIIGECIMFNFNFKKIKEEKGAVEVVEAAFVFPIVIFVVILFMMFGNMLYQQAKMDAIAVRGAEYLATIYTNPILSQDAIPTNSTQVDVKPYRYLFGDGGAEDKAKEFIRKEIDKTGTGLFSGMEMNANIKTCQIKNFVVYQTAQVEIEYSIELIPMKLFDSPSMFRCSNATVTAATDSAEFIRNIDMIMDYSEEFGLTQKIRDFVGAFTGN